MSKNLFNKLIIFAVVIFLGLITPSTFNLPSQTSIRAICTGLAIDIGEDDKPIMVSAQILIPEAGEQYKQKLSIISKSGQSIEDALELMEYQVGKKIRLAHCCFIILGNEICNQNMAVVLDYLIRGNNLGNNTLLLYTTKKAKDVLKYTSNVNSNEVDNLQIITRYNEQNLASNSANLLSFYDAYLSPHKTSYMANIDFDETQNQSSGGTSNSVSPTDTQNQNNQQETTKPDSIKTDGSVAVFYDGKMVKLLTADQREKFNWFDTQIRGSMVKIENVTDEVLDNATLSYTIQAKKVSTKYQIVNNTPIIKVKFDLGLRLEMIQQPNGKSLPVYSNYISEVVSDKFNTLINEAMTTVTDIQREYGFDVFNFYHQFSINCRNDWYKYLDSLQDNQNYMQNIEIFAEVNCFNEY